jgi:hypothetical protein
MVSSSTARRAARPYSRSLGGDVKYDPRYGSES